MAYKPNPPLWGGKIEPGIRPLVDALNATGIVRTTSSCEAHYGYSAPDDSNRRDVAYVAFELAEGITEDQLVDLFKDISEQLLRGPRSQMESGPRDLSPLGHNPGGSSRLHRDALLDPRAPVRRSSRPMLTSAPQRIRCWKS